MCNQLLKHFCCAILIMAIFSIIALGNVSKKDLVIPEAGKTQIITLEDGSSLVGRTTKIGDVEIKFQSDLGEMTISIDKIVEIKEVENESFRGGKYWFPNPNRTRLYFGTTGRMLKKGEGYISDTYIFFPGFALGLTDNITIGGGFSIFPGLSMNEQLFYFTPKIGIKAHSKIDLAASALIIRIPGDAVLDDKDKGVTIGVLNFVGTVGSDDNSFTVGLGYGFADGEMAKQPAVLLGGEWRFSRRLSFVSENWLFPEIEKPIISYGIRFFSESLTTNLAFFNILDDDAIFPGIPFIDFVWNF